MHGREDHVSACWLPTDEEERRAERTRVQAALAAQSEISTDVAKGFAEVTA